jgi:hypothetical protein
VQSGPSISSLVDLQLYVDLYSYPLQQLIGTSYSLPRPAACQHHKVLRPRQLKLTLLTMHATVTAASICRVASPPTHELIAFTMLTGMRFGIVLYARKFRPCALTKLEPWFPFIL